MNEWVDHFVLNPAETQLLRSLARQVADLASRPVEAEKRDLWYKHNALEPTRPLVFCDPENGWWEVIKKEDLECEGQFARSWEWRLRREIFWGEKMRDDRVIESRFDVPYVSYDSGWGMHGELVTGGPGGSYTWDPPLKSYDDMRLLHFPEIKVDEAGSDKIREMAESVAGGILEIERRMGWWWSLGMTQTLINLRGLDRIMYDMLDQPEELHRLMGFLRDGHLAKLDFLEANGLLTLNNDGSYVGSGGFGWTHELPQPDFSGRVRTRDTWCLCESQETVGVSPEMFAEFVFPYQLPIMERFGLNCYGCCEPLDTRWHIIRQMPRLRRVSVSPWSSLEKMAENLGDRYIFSMKPNPADLAHPTFDEERIRKSLREALRVTKGCRVEIIMKDCHTICNDPDRVIRWVQIAKEEAEAA